MIDFARNQTKKLFEVAQVERAQAGKIYKKGCLLIKLSACDDSVGYLEQDMEVERRYAVIIPNNDINSKYFFYAFNRVFAKFLNKYQTTINLQFDVLEKMELEIHADTEAQQKIAEIMMLCENAEVKEEKFVEYSKSMKQYFLDKMMV